MPCEHDDDDDDEAEVLDRNEVHCCGLWGGGDFV